MKILKRLLPTRLKTNVKTRIRIMGARVRYTFGLTIVFRDSYGFQYKCDNLAAFTKYVREGQLQPKVEEYLRMILKSGDTVIDIGANIGTISFSAAEIVSPNGEVFAFEPEDANYKKLVHNIDLNKLTSYITPIKAAIYSHDGNVTLNVFNASQFHSVGHYNIGEYGPHSEEIVSSMTLDQFIEGQHLSQIALLKVDVEGAEPDVFSGAKKSLEKHIFQQIIFEISIVPLTGNGYVVEDVFQPLLDAGYSLHILEATSNPKSLNASDVEHAGYGNYLALSPERTLR
jgi:FkbM family methyltransferase